ncbi:FAD-dependent oxidoreductase [Wenjunlia vitaminophila]|uniref:FAD-dependent oxidoreductase n=1 Tax=Wenjunlia vitaminophila TaxID=76728 RepID=A0A0T6LN25_WENVI|nr:FAD-dependent oxidoreductase [Wenjunlia vitaminophila]
MYDVAIIGTGLGGSMLGAILARNGARVLLLDQTEHPKFAIGESTIPNMLVSLRTMAARYDVPELVTLSSFAGCQRIIGPSNGVKNHFGFLVHQEGRQQDPAQVTMYNFTKLIYPTAHFYRQDTDAYLLRVAVGYGCALRQRFRTASVEFDDSGVTITGDSGEEFRSRYVVDASGYRSVIAEKFGLREDPCRYKHHSRSIWNHMIDVPDTDQVFARPTADAPPVPWYEGTIHHLFERGWFWVIPFNNDPSSRNPLCSVGLTLDPRRYPVDHSLTPEQEFWAHARRFPDIARQFAGARPVREWVRTDRLQYSSSRTVGDRWALLSHAAGFIDPLFSRGMSNTCEVVNVLAWRLLRATRDGDFSAERFRAVDRFQQALLTGNDELVNAAFISFEDYRLWSAVFRIWAWGSNAGSFRAHEAFRRWRADGDERHLLELEDAENPELHWSDHEGYRQMFSTMVERCGAYEAGRVTAREAADALHEQLASASYVPRYYGWDDPTLRFINPTSKVMAKTMWWALREAPPDVRRIMLGFGREATKEVLRGRRIF